MLAPLVLLVFTIFYIGAIMQPRWALAVLLMLFPMKQALQGSVSIISQTPTLANYLIGIVVGIGLVWGIFRGKIKFGGYLNLIWIAVAFGYFYFVKGQEIVWKNRRKYLHQLGLCKRR